jgi:uncharacterized membrane protein
MPVKISDQLTVPAASSKLVVAGVVGVSAGVVAALMLTWRVAPLVAWDAAAIVYLLGTWPRVLRLDAKLVRSHALREDSSRVMSDVILLIASVASLGGVGLVLVKSGSSAGGALVGNGLLGLLSVILSWLVIHTVFALRYAEMYYTAPEGGVNFGEREQPVYVDFAYLAFTLGMTYQVSDTPFVKRAFRVVALRHILLSYLFGTVIIAATINLIAGLGK